MKAIISNILFAFAKKKQIPASKVICELFAEELIKQGAIIPVYCHECSNRNDEGFCFKDVALPGYKKTHIFGYCDKGEKSNA